MESRIFDGSAVGTKVEGQTAKEKKILEKIKRDAIELDTRYSDEEHSANDIKEARYNAIFNMMQLFIADEVLVSSCGKREYNRQRERCVQEIANEARLGIEGPWEDYENQEIVNFYECSHSLMHIWATDYMESGYNNPFADYLKYASIKVPRTPMTYEWVFKNSDFTNIRLEDEMVLEFIVYRAFNQWATDYDITQNPNVKFCTWLEWLKVSYDYNFESEKPFSVLDNDAVTEGYKDKPTIEKIRGELAAAQVKSINNS